MRRLLHPHPHSRPRAAGDISVSLAWPRPGHLLIAYRLSGRPDGIRLPPTHEGAGKNELWRETCFEAFIGAAPGGYYELNFSPSGQWAALHFDDYRTGSRAATELDTVEIDLHVGAEGLALQASLDLRKLTCLPRSAPLRLGLAAVIEETDGTMSYWALAHPPGKPDFHHSAGFVCALSPAAAS